jgi:hypothetical protein
MKTSVKYRIHRTIAIIVLPLLLISITTGFFRANQKWYWEDGYKRKKHPPAISIEKELIPVKSLVEKVDSISQKKNKFQEISLQAENEALYYKLITTSKGRYLVEAYTGTVVSPLSSKLASAFALQYVKEKPAVKSVELLKKYIARRGKEIKPAYKVMFDNDVHSEIYLDYYTGEIIEDIDDNRQFGMWVLRLHEYDFFDSKRSITSMVGISMLLLSFSGLWIYKIRLKNKKENAH